VEHGGQCVNPGAVAPDVLKNPKLHEHYHWLMKEVRGQMPFKNAGQAPVRPNLPM
jgi:hypothetical protein